ncbi:ATP-binding protein [Streptomyces sp. MCC20]|uniref:ATP-binding protein n=1 Tax=Streptomyces sediminimaris TaxID=3383721 RepID=UPI00399C2ADA
MRLPRDAAHAATVRSLTRIWLGEALGVPAPRLEDAVLVVSEFFALAVRHGTGPEAGLHLRCGAGGPSVRLEVVGYWMSGCPPVPRTRPCLRLIAGVVAGLNGRWGFGGNGALAWCTVPLPRDGAGEDTPAAPDPGAR